MSTVWQSDHREYKRYCARPLNSFVYFFLSVTGPVQIPPWINKVLILILSALGHDIKRKRKRSDSVLWQKPLHQQKCQKGKVTTQTTPQKIDYTAVADRLRTVSWSNYGHPTGVVNPVYGPNLPTPRNSRVIKRTRVYKFVDKPPYIDNKPTATPSGEVIEIDTSKA